MKKLLPFILALATHLQADVVTSIPVTLTTRVVTNWTKVSVTYPATESIGSYVYAVHRPTVATWRGQRVTNTVALFRVEGVNCEAVVKSESSLIQDQIEEHRVENYSNLILP